MEKIMDNNEQILDLGKRLFKSETEGADLREALRLIAIHPVMESQEWEVAVKEMQKIAVKALEKWASK